MSSIFHSVKEISAFITSILILTMLVITFGFMGYSIIYVAPYINQHDFLIPIYIVAPFPFLIAYLGGIIAYIWYIFLAIAASVSGILLLSYGIIPYYRSFVKKPMAYRKNPFQDLSELYALNIFFSMAIIYIMYLIGFTPHTPGIGKMPVWGQMLSLLHASVYEELIVRTVFLGIPVFAIYKLRGDNISPIRIFGGYGKITKIEATFIVISAGIFGLAHVPSWTAWKAIPAFVGGLILGYLYIKYGIYASIMTHFMTDFITIPMAMSPIFQYLFGIFMMFFAIVGVVFFVSYSIRVINFFSGKKENYRKEKPTSPPTFTQSWSSIKCPNCGGTVFQYVDKETVRCVQCGTIIHINKEKDDESDNYFM